MSADLEQALRHAFRDTAETVVPDPDPMRRLLRRRRRRWAGVTSLFVAAAVALAAGLVPALQPAAPERPFPRLPAWTRALLDSPTRGSLAGDADLVRAVRDRAAATATGGLTSVKVLFLGEAEGRRFVAYVRYDRHLAVLFRNDTPVGDSVEHLVDAGPGGPLEPLVTITSTEVPVIIGVAPAACTIEMSIGGSVSEDDDVQRNWVVPYGSWIMQTSRDLPQRWRVSCENKVRSEGPPVPVGDLDDRTDLFAVAGFQHEPPVPRWSGTIEGAEGTWRLSTARLPDGSVAAVLATGPADRYTVATAFETAAGPVDRAGWGLVSTAVSHDPDVIAIRVPYRANGRALLGDRVLVLAAKPGAAEVIVRAEIGTLGAPLHDGVAPVNAASGPVLVQDAAGARIATTWLPERVPQVFGEKTVSGWYSG
ncbi:hypothetical protein ACFO1B_11915 [Dactylosporangium siamense]|uniref:Uncharacterized protein n=1 Tax=Dactylosporangium siamense TaxID=685454 RepID=A0A919PJA3_9ACTN|nr:hypothetical protein [Dactylosporangium siamense]GIG44507.1 hypothetical protein Dsi01nite_025480 [Dactylosporangium siamense]